MTIPETHSEVARIRKQIALEIEAAHRGLHASAMTAPHRFISERLARVGTYQAQLAQVVGETEALQIVADVLESLPEEGSLRGSLQEQAGGHEMTYQEQPKRSPRGPKRGTDAAKRGGQGTAAAYGLEWYAQIGKKGGDVMKQKHTHDKFYHQIGKRGGEATKRVRGSDFYAEIGKKGGARGRTAR